jgi:hypothetical protein
MKILLTLVLLALLALTWLPLLSRAALLDALTPSTAYSRQAGYLLVDLEPFENVVPVGTATVTWNKLIGRTVNRVILALGGGVPLTKAMISNIRILANEKVIFEDSGPRTDDRMEYRGIASAAGFLTLDFNEIRAHNDMNKVAGAIDTISSGVKKLTAEVTTTVGSTAPTLTAQAMLGPSPQSGDAAFNVLLAKVLNKTRNYGAAGEFPFELGYQRHPLSLVKRIHFFGATVTAVRLKTTIRVNGAQVTDEIFKATDGQNDFIQLEYGRTPQASVYHLDFMVDGDVKECLALGQVEGMECYVTVSGAGNVTAVSELLDPLGNN